MIWAAPCLGSCSHLQALHPDKGAPQALLSGLFPVTDLPHTNGSLTQTDLANLLSWHEQWPCPTSICPFLFLLLDATVKPVLHPPRAFLVLLHLHKNSVFDPMEGDRKKSRDGHDGMGGQELAPMKDTAVTLTESHKLSQSTS